MLNVSLATARDVIARRTNTNTPDRQIGVALFAEVFVRSCPEFDVQRFANAVERRSVEIALEAVTE